jgi:hypothetical protein
VHSAQRERYLATLGIVRYRRRRSGGRAPEETQIPCAPAAEAESVAARERPEPPAGPSGTAPVEELAPARLACWRPAADLLVLDALPPGQRPERERLTLLANILRAIDRLPGALPAAEFIDWPPLPGGDHSLSGAREALALFLAGRMAREPFAWVLAMGEPARRWLGGGEHSEAGARISLADGRAQGILVPGLGDMLAAPQLKAQTWQAIRGLVPERR